MLPFKFDLETCKWDFTYNLLPGTGGRDTRTVPMFPQTSKLKIGSYDEWIKLSDHMPIVLELNTRLAEFHREDTVP